MFEIAALVAVMTAPCNLALPGPSTGPWVGPRTTVTMALDRSVTMQLPNGSPDEVLKPGTPNYDGAIFRAGGLSPGQTKLWPMFIGTVTANPDGSFELSSNRGPEYTMAVRPGDPEYLQIAALIGPLKPGDWVELKDPEPRGCEPRH